MQLFLSILISRGFTFGHTQLEACTQQIMSAFLEHDSGVQESCSDLLLHSGGSPLPPHSSASHLHLSM